MLSGRSYESKSFMMKYLIIWLIISLLKRLHILIRSLLIGGVLWMPSFIGQANLMFVEREWSPSFRGEYKRSWGIFEKGVGFASHSVEEKGKTIPTLQLSPQQERPRSNLRSSVQGLPFPLGAASLTRKSSNQR
jgi:hypothetical protein